MIETIKFWRYKVHFDEKYTGISKIWSEIEELCKERNYEIKAKRKESYNTWLEIFLGLIDAIWIFFDKDKNYKGYTCFF